MHSSNDSKFRWTVGDLLAVQIAILPLLLIPFYSATFLDSEYYSEHPFRSLFKVFLAPFVYVSLMTFVMLRRRRPARSKVFAAIRYGIACGLFFLLCVFGLQNIPFLFDHFCSTVELVANWHKYAEVMEQEPNMLVAHVKPYLVSLIAVSYFAVSGAAVGGIVGIACDRNFTNITSAGGDGCLPSE